MRHKSLDKKTLIIRFKIKIYLLEDCIVKKFTVFFISLSFIFLFSINSMAAKKGNPFTDGTNVVNAGVGFGWYGGASGWDTKIPPVSVAYDRGVTIKDLPLSFGGIFSIAQYGYEQAYYTYNLDYSYTFLIFGARAAWHFDVGVENLDLYAGVTLGFYYQTWDYTIEPDLEGYNPQDDSGASIMGGAYAGARYFFTDMIGAYVELGYDIGYFKLGLSVMF